VSILKYNKNTYYTYIYSFSSIMGNEYSGLLPPSDDDRDPRKQQNGRGVGSTRVDGMLDNPQMGREATGSTNGYKDSNTHQRGRKMPLSSARRAKANIHAMTLERGMREYQRPETPRYVGSYPEIEGGASTMNGSESQGALVEATNGNGAAGAEHKYGDEFPLPHLQKGDSAPSSSPAGNHRRPIGSKFADETPPNAHSSTPHPQYHPYHAPAGARFESSGVVPFERRSIAPVLEEGREIRPYNSVGHYDDYSSGVPLADARTTCTPAHAQEMARNNSFELPPQALEMARNNSYEPLPPQAREMPRNNSFELPPEAREMERNNSFEDCVSQDRARFGPAAYGNGQRMTQGGPAPVQEVFQPWSTEPDGMDDAYGTHTQPPKVNEVPISTVYGWHQAQLTHHSTQSSLERSQRNVHTPDDNSLHADGYGQWSAGGKNNACSSGFSSPSSSSSQRFGSAEYHATKSVVNENSNNTMTYTPVVDGMSPVSHKIVGRRNGAPTHTHTNGGHPQEHVNGNGAQAQVIRKSPDLGIDQMFDGYQSLKEQDNVWKLRYEEELVRRKQLEKEMKRLEVEVKRLEEEIAGRPELEVSIATPREQHDEAMKMMRARLAEQDKLIAEHEECKLWAEELTLREEQMNQREEAALADADGDTPLWSKEIRRLNELVTQRESDIQNLKEISALEMAELTKKCWKCQTARSE